MGKLLILGGTIDPRRQMVAEQDRLLERFLKAFEKTKGSEATPRDNPYFWFGQSTPYYPFKNSPVPHHWFSDDSVMGLAELILEEEAASVGISPRLMAFEEIFEIPRGLKDPTPLSAYDMLAFSTTYIFPSLLLFLLKFIARYIPQHVKIFIGGPGACKIQEEELQDLRFDYILRSEAEGRFRKLLRHAMGDKVDLAEIPGLTWRQGPQILHSSEAYTYIDLNTVSLPDFQRMAAAHEGRVIYESSRGCPFRCEFCDYPFLMGNHKFRYKRAERIHEDWRVMHASMGVKDILCLDSTFTYPPERLKKLCTLLCDSGLNKKLRWGCYARPDDLAAVGTAERMREAGCEYVYVGFESGSQKVLGFMNKRITVEDNRLAITNCLDAGLMTLGLFIVGFPGETAETFRETRAFLQETSPFLLSVVPWIPDAVDDSKVPIMQPERRREFRIEVENPSSRKITLWRDCRFKSPVSFPSGSYWTHRGMDLQEAWDCICEVIQDIYDQKIRVLSEDFFSPRLLDDPLSLYQKLGARHAVDFYLGLSRLVLDDTKEEFNDWRQKIGLLC